MISPHTIAKAGTEHAHQAALFQWIATTGSKRYPLMRMAHAVPNGSVLIGSGTDRGRSEGSKMKAEGLKAGVPDVFVPVTLPSVLPLLGRYRWPGLWIEMKKPGREKDKDGGCSEDQVKWHADLYAQGYAVALAYGWIPATHMLALYFSGEFMMPNDPGAVIATGQTVEAW